MTEKVAIVLLTAATTPERTQYAQVALMRVIERLKSEDTDLMYHIGDDGSSQAHRDTLCRILDNHDIEPSITNSGKMGYGANYNLAMKTVHEEFGVDYVLPLEDDWELTREFNIDPILCTLRDDIFDSVRMGYIGYTQPLHCTFRYHNDEHYLLLRDDSEEPHVFSGHPRLETVSYQQRVGPWPEGLTPGATEWAVATTMPEARRRVGYPLWASGDVKNGIFAHIGTVKSY